MTAAERKWLELLRKLGSLDEEWQDWRAASADKQPFAKHHSQIEQVTGRLETLRAGLAKRLEDARKQPDKADVRALEKDILALHRVWGFFRDKLLQRGLPRLRQHLAVVDELAWACALPARERALQLKTVPAGALREPPLVFFDGYSTPFMQARDTAFALAPVPDEPIEDKRVTAFLARLPLPVIGIPWFQTCHLPEALIVAHEVGHVVDHELELGASIAKAAAGASADGKRAAAWRAWAGESFADVYATLALGAAYVRALCDFLADRRADLVAETAGASDLYPTAFLRIALCVATLRRCGDAAGADAVAAEWQDAYGGKHAMAAFMVDVPDVAAALCNGPYAALGGALTDVLKQGDTERKAVESCRKGLLAGEQPDADPRTVFAAAAALYRADAAQLDDEVQRRIRDGVIARAGTATRAGGGDDDGTDGADAGAARARADAALLDAFSALTRAPT